MAPATTPGTRPARDRLGDHPSVARPTVREDDAETSSEPQWLRDESAAEALADRTWSAIRWDPGRRGTAALAGVGLVVAVVAAFFFWHQSPTPAPVPPLPEPALAKPVVSEPESEPAADIVVSVVGLVGRGGLVTLPAGSRVADALEAAGGASAGADVLSLNLAHRLADGDQVVVGTAPPPGTPIATSSTGTDDAASAGAGSSNSGASNSGASDSGAVSLNSATESDLDALPGVGPVTAASIVKWRNENGPFTSVDQLGEVAGIGPARLNTLRPLVTL